MCCFEICTYIQCLALFIADLTMVTNLFIVKFKVVVTAHLSVQLAQHSVQLVNGLASHRYGPGSIPGISM